MCDVANHQIRGRDSGAGPSRTGELPAPPSRTIIAPSGQLPLLDVMEKELVEISTREPALAESGHNEKQPIPEAAVVEASNEASADGDYVYPPFSTIVSVGVTMMMVLLLVHTSDLYCAYHRLKLTRQLSPLLHRLLLLNSAHWTILAGYRVFVL
jgi:hypothetical protein